MLGMVAPQLWRTRATSTRYRSRRLHVTVSPGICRVLVQTMLVPFVSRSPFDSLLLLPFDLNPSRRADPPFLGIKLLGKSMNFAFRF